MTTNVIIQNPWPAAFQRDSCLNKEYQLLLDEIISVALKDIREDEFTKDECIKKFRDWIKQNNDIENCILDDTFLLRFLRIKKYSILMAQQTLLKYLNFRKRFRHFMYNMDFLDSKVNELISNGYIFVSPYRDSQGRRIIIYNIKKFDLQKYSNTDMSRAHAITYESLMDAEENQILGINHVADMSGLTPGFITLFSINDFTTIVRWGEQSFPMSHKAINVINMPSALKYLYDQVTSLVSKKLTERIFMHNSCSDLHTQVDKYCLPQEFGGSMPSSEMIRLWKDELASKRDRLLLYDQMNLLSDQGIITRRNMQRNGDSELPGSFRRLELD